MIRVEDIGIVDGFFVQAVYKDDELIGYNYSQPPVEGDET